MDITEVQNRLKKIVKKAEHKSFIYDLLLAYGLPKASITRLKKGAYDLSKRDDQVSWKKKVLFQYESSEDLHLTISELEKSSKHDERFIIVTDFVQFLAKDTLTNDSLDIEFSELPKHYDFFLPWAGMEKAQHQNENPADVKAAAKMAKLFDTIRKNNAIKEGEEVSEDGVISTHAMNVFLSRLLFCFFAEDTHIFHENAFTNAISSHTKEDGSDLSSYLQQLFTVLDTPENQREDLPEHFKVFPYVNGELFSERHQIPNISRASRKALIEAGQLEWKDINPDIFGSMFQAVIGEDQRGNLGQHYTSVPNIMKVIEPLFLNDLNEALEKARGNKKQLEALLLRLSKIKIFDPACGSGNFLIIAYKELCRLERKVFQAIDEITKQQSSPSSLITLNQFYGIEIDDFAHEVAILSLWLAEHQMNVEFMKQFGRTKPTLPLKEAGKIVHANACRIDWSEICPRELDDETYLLGNPPFLGTRNQNSNHKSDIDFVFSKFKKRRKLDYISNWFYLASKYINNSKGAFAFVSTNSICQGEQVPILWPLVLGEDKNIFFAYNSFKWTNSAKSNAQVTVVIIGINSLNNKEKYIYSDNQTISAKNINAYLVSANNQYVYARSNALSNLPKIVRGNYTGCCNSLIFDQKEKNKILSIDKSSNRFIKEFLGSNEFLNDVKRFCLWIDDKDLDEAISNQLIREKVDLTRLTREESSDKGQQKIAYKGHQFREFNRTKSQSILIPVVSSERRAYIPSGFTNPEQIIPNSAMSIYDADPYILGVVSSRMHMTWVKSVAGKLETRIRYSSTLCYNTFPFPEISEQRKQQITQCVFRILEEREKHPEKTLAELYAPDKMPEGLLKAHQANDEVIERCYRSKPFETDEERLAYLFKLYEKMTAEA